MDRAAFEERLASLRSDWESAWAQVNALVGAIQDTEFWLAKFEEEEREARGAQGEADEDAGAEARHPADASEGDEP